MKYLLNNLSVRVIGNESDYNCSHKQGSGFIVQGENLKFFNGTKQFSHYALASLMPYIAAKQRSLSKNDWMRYETDIACPDPKCGAIFRIEIAGTEEYNYGD